MHATVTITLTFNLSIIILYYTNKLLSSIYSYYSINVFTMRLSALINFFHNWNSRLNADNLLALDVSKCGLKCDEHSSLITERHVSISSLLNSYTVYEVLLYWQLPHDQIATNISRSHFSKVSPVNNVFLTRTRFRMVMQQSRCD